VRVGYRGGMTDDASGGAAPEELAGIPGPGDVIGGKFSVESVLGIGGMGVVVAARHVHLGQRVAIKFLRKDAAKQPEAVSRFLREARSAVGLQSANVVRVTDVGTLDSGLPYMVMEHLSGTDLGQVLEERRTLPVDEAVDYVLQAMEAIAEAHAVGIVHRDLKPANLFLASRPDGSPLVKVLDFGISKAADAGGGSSQQNLTATTAVMGSPLYMSPEQLRSSKNVDARTDVWALGVIVYELLAGVPPFEAETVTGLCAKIVADPPVPLRTRCPELPVALEQVVMRCLEKDVTRRPQSVGDLALALEPFASPEGRTSVARVVRIARPSPARQPMASLPDEGSRSGGVHGRTGYAETVATWQTTASARRKRAVTVVVGALAAGVVVLGVVTFAFMHAGHSGADANAATPVTAAAAAPPAPSAVPPAALLAPPAAAASTAAAAASGAPAAAPPPSVAARPSRAAPSHAPRGAPRPAPTAARPSTDDLLLDRK